MPLNHQMILGTAIPVSGGASDADAAAFLTAAAITDPVIVSAIDAYVIALKAASIWTKMVALYPFVGGDATKHSFNLKNPAAFQITWAGGVTHDADGITPNGTTGYGDTGIVASTDLVLDDVHLSVYSRTAGAGAAAEWEFAALDGGGNSVLEIATNHFGAFRAKCYSQGVSGNDEIDVANANGEGFYILSRRAINDFEAYKNGSSVATISANRTRTPPARPLFLGAKNSAGSATEFSPKNLTLASAGLGLTDTDVTAFNTASETLQDALSRGVV